MEQFQGLTEYCYRYISGYRPVTAPISDLREKDAEDIWAPKCKGTMVDLKDALRKLRCWRIQDFAEDAKRFEVKCDASGLGINAGLFQSDKVIAFENRGYRLTEVNYTVGNQNSYRWYTPFMSEGVKEGAPRFKVVMDHNPLIWHADNTFDAPSAQVRVSSGV